MIEETAARLCLTRRDGDGRDDVDEGRKCTLRTVVGGEEGGSEADRTKKERKKGGSGAGRRKEERVGPSNEARDSHRTVPA